jgi:cation:H+ antiporter
LVLATVAYGVTGAMLLARRRSRTRVAVAVAAGGGAPAPAESGDDLGDQRKLARDQTWFLIIFIVKVILGLVAFAIKPWLGLAFFAAYGVYFWKEIRGGGSESEGEGEDLAPLLLQRRRARPATWAVLTQTLAALAVIFAASQLFVHQLDAIGPMLGLPAAVTALLLSPIATELPEIMNAIIWVRQGKTPLALANISGAMMIQATVPSGLGLLFTPWHFDAALLVSGLVTMVAIGYLLILLYRRRFSAKVLTFAAVFYLAFAACLIPILT